jgi:hypothetical protein
VGTSGTQVFTSAGKDIQLAALKVNGAGGTVQFADTFWSGQINLTNGTLDTNNQQWTTNLFNLSVGTKTLKLTNSHGIIAGTGISWDSATNQTNLTLTHGGASKLTFNGGVALTTMLVGGASGQAYDDIEFLGGAGGFTLSGQSLLYRDLLCSSPGASIVTVGNGVFRNIDFTGFLGTWNETLGTSFLGNLVFVAGMALTNATTITARGTGLQTITMAGLSATFQLNILATVGTNTVQLLDTFSGTKPVKIQKDGCGIISKAGVTNTCSLFSAVGTAGSPCTLASDTPGSPTTWSVATNEQKATALSVTDVYVTGGARWWTGRFGVDNGGNSGWRFTDWALRRPYF